MAINITGKFKPQGNFALVDAVDVEMPDGTRLGDLDLGSLKVVRYDLVAMGVPDIVINGNPLQLQTDTTEIMEIMAKSIITLNLNFSYNGLVFNNVKVTLSPNSNATTISLLNTIVFVSVYVTEGKIMIGAELAKEQPAVATNIDLSAFESDGRIVETFADGATATTTMEFNDNGKPIKITDSNGNVTTLVW